MNINVNQEIMNLHQGLKKKNGFKVYIIKQQRLQDIDFINYLYPISLVCSLPPFVFAARAIARANHDLNEGGILWFMDLTQPDIYTILPFVGITLTWCVFAFRSGRWLDGRYTGQFHKYLSYGYFALSSWPLIMIALFVDLPTGIFMYWIPFSLFGLFCKITLRHRGFRKKLNLPVLSLETVKIDEPLNNRLNKYYHSY